MRASASAAVLIATLVQPVVARAQTHTAIDMAAGYAFLSDRQLHASFPAGWTAAAERNVTDRLAIAIEFGHHHDRSTYEETATITGPGICSFICLGTPPDRVFESVRGVGTRSLNDFSLVAGLRYRKRAVSVAPFARAMAGLVSVRSDFNVDHYVVEYPNPGVSVPPEQLVASGVTTTNRFAVQFGAGLEFPASRNTHARIGTDYRKVFFSLKDQSENLTQLRVSAELVVGFGAR